jgi:hypothetical protein
MSAHPSRYVRFRDLRIRGGATAHARRCINTLSNSADQRSPEFTTVRGLSEHENADAGERRRTGVSETKTETTVPGATGDRLVSAGVDRSLASPRQLPEPAERLTSFLRRRQKTGSRTVGGVCAKELLCELEQGRSAG